MNVLLMMLLRYLSPRVEDDFEPVDDTPDPVDTPDEDVPADDDELEDTPAPEDDDPAPEPRISRAQKAIIDARSRAQTAERELAEARRELQESRRAPAQPATPTQDQVLWQQEEETLRNPEATDWQKYAINANRSARMANTNSQNALQRAEDLADKTAFAAIAATKPKVYAAYKDKVEARLTELRAKGNNAPREALLALLVGQDMLAGKVKATTSGTKKPSSAPRASARSDVSATPGRLSDHEKRAKRLENIRI